MTIRRRPGIALALLLAVLVAVAATLFWPQPVVQGLDIHARNDTDRDYELHIDITDQEGRPLGRLTMPVAARSLARRQLDTAFERVQIHAWLTVPDAAEPIIERRADWPGEAGTAAGAASDRVAIDLRIEQRDGELTLEFAGVL